MLDWLSNNHGASATEDSQVPDAPETPAPIFAYRALKGILFGSPDDDDEDEDKENVAPAIPDPTEKGAQQVTARDAAMGLTPVRPKPTQLPSNQTRERQPVSPSPRKRRQMSPTKSILRTPGIPTPRRQNVNVTFRDVRPSISPVAVTAKLQAAQNESKAVISSERSINTTRATIATAPPGSGKAGDEVGVLPVQVYDTSSIDAYLKSTEREMKKLIRYGQRMKEYARVSQQENVALRKERDDLMREIEKLRSGKIKTKGVSDEQAMKDELDVRGIRWRRGAGNTGGKRPREAVSGAEWGDKSHALKAARLTDKGASAGHEETHEPRTKWGNHQAGQNELAALPMRDERQDVVSKKRAASTAQLAPDRLAAAKERLRVKSEERRRALSATVG